jgi:hypothetical protein
MPDKRVAETAPPPDPTPGRPKSTGSRQQTHPDQKSQTGSAESDKDFTEQTGLSEQFKQPGTK